MPCLTLHCNRYSLFTKDIDTDDKKRINKQKGGMGDVLEKNEKIHGLETFLSHRLSPYIINDLQKK